MTTPAPSLAIPCMGGWCALRDHCQHYHSVVARSEPSERLCRPGQDGKSDIHQVHVTPAARVVPIASQEIPL